MADRELSLSLKAQHFSLIRKALHAREAKLIKIIERKGEASEEGASTGSDKIHVRLYKKELKEKAGAVFFPNVLELNEEPLAR